MKVALVRDDGAAPVGNLADRVAESLQARGHLMTPPSDDIDLVLNLTSAPTARVNYVRPNSSVFVASLMRSEDDSAWSDLEALKRATYAVLVKTLSNVVVHEVASGPLGGVAYFMTPELGFRTRANDLSLADAIVDYVTPLAGARMVIENRLDEDLAPKLWDGDESALELMKFGRRLAGMNLLPSVFDMRQLLDERELRLAMKIFGLKQLSYGNLSCRCDARSFWMSGRGVDKGNMRVIGRDLLLVKGYEPSSQTILLSVPPGCDPTARVSVDAIEHYKIYEALPEVGAIVHVHAWVPGTPATLQSWPCGSEQLADEVLGLVLAAPDPTRAIVGLKNHGLTITGRSLDEIFARIEGRLVQDIPALD
ncbi:MAG: class II aldolase/adducin family protein [Acidobacteriota bacterium]